jgi:hypothetical protein
MIFHVWPGTFVANNRPVDLASMDNYTTSINGFPGGNTSPISTAGTPALVRAMSKDAASERATESSNPLAV